MAARTRLNLNVYTQIACFVHVHNGSAFPRWSKYSSRYSDSLGAGRSRVRTPVGRARFSYPSRPAPGPARPPVQWVPASFSGVKRPGRGANRAEAKNGWCYTYTSTSPLWLLDILRHSIVWKLLGGGLRSPFGSEKTWQIPRGIERVCGKSTHKDKVALST